MARVATAAVLEQFEQANNLLARGELQPAATLCKQILAQDETFAPAYSLMGELWRQIGNIDNAVKFLALAIKFDPKNPNFHVQHGQCLILKEEWDEALSELEKAQKLDKKNPIAFILAGDVYLQRRDYQRAIDQFMKAKSLKDMPEIEEHMGLCYQEMGDIAKAEKSYRNVIERKPDYFHAYIQLGNLLMMRGGLEEAEKMFDKALECNPDSHEALAVKARFEVGDGDNTKALETLQRAIQVAPYQYRPYYYVGLIYQGGKHFERATPFFEKVVELKPDFLPGQQALAVALVNAGRKQEAQKHIEAVLNKDPSNESFAHILAAMKGETPENAPEEYVRSLFDGYAEQFEEHLTQKLGYKTPFVLAEALSKTMESLQDTRTDLALADLGCGTGLGAEALMDLTGYRAGVDLAGKMVEKARAKGIFDHLDVDDVVRFLEKSDQRYDLITAVDVLVYIGNLEPLFSAAKAKLNGNGYFAISVEKGDDAPPYVLRQSSRYAHAAEYLESLAAQHGMNVVAKEATVLRQEGGQPMDGYIFIFQLPH